MGCKMFLSPWSEIVPHKFIQVRLGVLPIGDAASVSPSKYSAFPG
jgi:hypothetical protein